MRGPQLWLRSRFRVKWLQRRTSTESEYCGNLGWEKRCLTCAVSVSEVWQEESTGDWLDCWYWKWLLMIMNWNALLWNTNHWCQREGTSCNQQEGGEKVKPKLDDATAQRGRKDRENTKDRRLPIKYRVHRLRFGILRWRIQYDVIV